MPEPGIVITDHRSTARKILSGVMVVALTTAAMVTFATAAQAAGPVCTVGPAGDYTTIQAAVNDVGCATINVAAGTYNEQASINRTVTLNGAQAGVDARTRSGSESIITNACGPVQIEADKVKIDGFTIEGSTLADPCLLAGIWTNPGFSGTQGGHTIVNNIVQNNISGIELDSTCVNPTLVQYNLIRNNNNPGPGSGNAIQTNFGLCNATIDANTFSGHLSSSMLVVAPSSLLTVTNNRLAGGAFERVVWLGVTNGSVSNNVSVGATATSVVDLAGGNSTIAVNGNVLVAGVRGIRVRDPFGVGPNSGVTAHNNCISGNTTAGLEVVSGSYSPVAPNALDATGNWWGNATGPTIASNPGGTGDAILDPDVVVGYTPFLTAPTGAPDCPVPAATARSQKQKALDELNTVGPINKDTDKRIADAKKQIQASLDRPNWVGDNRLDFKKAEQIFDLEKKAVTDLKGIKGTAPAAVGQAIADLVEADRIIAQTAIDDKTPGGNAKKLAEANKEMGKASDELAKDHPDGAIEHYKNAWKQAQQA